MTLKYSLPRTIRVSSFVRILMSCSGKKRVPARNTTAIHPQIFVTRLNTWEIPV